MSKVFDNNLLLWSIELKIVLQTLKFRDTLIKKKVLNLMKTTLMCRCDLNSQHQIILSDFLPYFVTMFCFWVFVEGFKFCRVREAVWKKTTTLKWTHLHNKEVQECNKLVSFLFDSCEKTFQHEHCCFAKG